MTLAELNEHYALLRRLAEAQGILDALRASALGTQDLSGMPRASGTGDRVGDLAVEILQAEAEVGAILERVRAREADVAAYIDSIPDFQTRTVFRLRFLRGLAWIEVAEAMGGGNSAEGVKQICYRYLRSLKGRKV